MTVGLLPMGTVDGLTTMFENGNCFVTIRAHRCPIIGTMCMDHCVIDLTNVPDPQVGEEIVVIGDGSTTGPYDGGDGTGDGAYNVAEVAAKRGISNVDEVMSGPSDLLCRECKKALLCLCGGAGFLITSGGGGAIVVE